jgi:hypothetical protein
MIAFMQAGLAIGELRLRAKDLRPVLIVILAGLAEPHAWSLRTCPHPEHLRRR